MRYSFFFPQPARMSKKTNKREWYILYCWQLYDGKRKSASHWELLHQGGRWSKIEGGDTVNKGDIVCNADDNQAAAKPLSACDTSSLKRSPALSFSDLFHPPSTPLSFLFPSIATTFFFFLLQSWQIGLDISLSPSSYPGLGAFLYTFSFISLQSTGKPNTRSSSDLVSTYASIYTHERHTFPQTYSPMHMLRDEDTFVESETYNISSYIRLEAQSEGKSWRPLGLSLTWKAAGFVHFFCIQVMICMLSRAQMFQRENRSKAEKRRRAFSEYCSRKFGDCLVFVWKVGGCGYWSVFRLWSHRMHQNTGHTKVGHSFFH